MAFTFHPPPFLIALTLGLVASGCASPASCTLGTGEEKICYELASGDEGEVDTLEGGCRGTFEEVACETEGARFSCGNTLYNFYTPAAASEVRTLRYDYYFWNPAYMAGGHCETAGGTHTEL